MSGFADDIANEVTIKEETEDAAVGSGSGSSASEHNHAGRRHHHHGGGGGSSGSGSDSPKHHHHHNMEQEKRIRREIANSNERRRMQSINAGFQSLRTLLPHHEGEKLSKAAILQQTAEYIYALEQEKTRLLSQNCQLKRLVNQHEVGDVPPKKRKTDGQQQATANVGATTLVGLGDDSAAVEEAKELRRQLDLERNVRLMLEDQVRSLEQQLFQQQIHYQDATGLDLQLVSADSVPPVAQVQTVVCSPPVSRSPSPSPVVVVAQVAASPEHQQVQQQPQQPQQQSHHHHPRLPSALEAAIKAEPKVEVERIPSPTPGEDVACAATRLYAANTSRQNLETIVEAIRHLEGDHLFGDEPAQDAPLALTTTATTVPTASTEVVIASSPSPAAVPLRCVAFRASAVQQHRPGVIVAKQHS